MEDKKRMKAVKVNYNLSWTYGVTIQQIRKDLDAIQALGANEVEIETYSEYGCEYIRVEAIENRLETDAEVRIRLNTEKQRLEDIKNREIRQLKELQQKYNI